LVWKREHNCEDGEDKEEDKEKGCGGNGSMVTKGRTFGTMRVPLSAASTRVDGAGGARYVGDNLLRSSCNGILRYEYSL
jgi:hypothetical protein